MLLDTSGLLCVYDENDYRHAQAAAYFRVARQMVTTNYVLAEFVALAHVRRISRRGALRFLTDLRAAPSVQVVWVQAELHDAAMILLHAQLDKTYSLCDAVSFELMRERGVNEALTTDRYFEQEGFVRLLPQ
ncbi:MAG: type II toxin-antitoxin system VapC family toxin [Pyrinomonadaceae bacterium]